MNETFTILTKFRITGRGIVYLIDFPKKVTIHVGDIMYDEFGHRFKVKGLDMGRGIPDNIDTDDIPLGIWFENIDKYDVSGDILTICF